MSAMITVEEALALVLASAKSPFDEENVSLAEAYGRVLARDVRALRTQPPFPNSAMDGYAVRAEDASAPGAKLRVIGKSAAGRAFAGRVGPGEAVRIFTGAPMPPGADAIAIQEDVRRDGDRIELAATVGLGENLRNAGMDFGAGEALLPAGRRLTPRDVALAAAANVTALAARRRARVAILATGDELVPPGRRSGRRRSSPRTISRSPGSSRPAAARRSTSASPPTTSARLALRSAARATCKPTCSSRSAARRSATTISCSRRWSGRAWSLASGASPCGPASR